MTVLRKSTVRPWPSVRRPSSSTCSSTLNTSGCAFSTSSSRITRVRLAAHRLGQVAALLVADIARRRADQARHRVLLHELGHVDADHAPPRCRTGTRPAPCTARSCRRRSGRGTGTSRSAGSGRPARRASGGSRSETARDRLVLADHALVQLVFHLQQLVALALAASSRPGCRSTATRPRRSPPRRPCCAAAAVSCISAWPAIFELRVPSSGIRPYCSSDMRCRSPARRAVSISRRARSSSSLTCAAPCTAAFSAFQISSRSAYSRSSSSISSSISAEALLRGLVRLLLQRLALDLQLDQAPVEPVHRLGLGVDLHADPRRRLVDQVDRLVRQQAVGDVAVRQRRPRRRSPGR